MNLNSFTFIFCLILYFSCVLCELPEGSDCYSDEGMKGTCTDIHKCMQFVKDLKEKNHPQVCSYRGNTPIVCCTDCETVNDTRSIIVDRFGLHHFKTGKKAHDKCIEYVINEQYPCQQWGGVQRYRDDEKNCYSYTLTVVTPVVAGGADGGRGQYPHMALLGYGDTLNTAEWMCGGSLISHKYILTAAHCLNSHTSGQVKYLALGILKRTDPPSTWQRYNVKKAIPHPEYKQSSKYHDIALIEADNWIKFNQLVLPACLNSGEGDEATAFAIGWGAKSHRRGLAETLQTVSAAKPVQRDRMQYFLSPEPDLVNGYNHTIQMCYGDRDKINDNCEGDSGGPLQVKSELSSCMETIIGVTSYGKPCGHAGGSGIYTRVSYYVPWIESIVWS